jgi:hypothetical protein
VNRRQSTPGRRRQQLFVYQELLPGDVFLVSSWYATSIVIKFATFSRFSHAAIYLGAGRYFEATSDQGSYVGCLKVHKCGFNVELKTPQTLLYHPEWHRAVVLRHSGIIGADCITPDCKKALRDKIYRAMLLHRGHEYAELSDLAGATRLPRFARRAKVRLLSNLEKLTKNEKTVPGMFCSAAVACILRTAGLPATSLPIENVSPGTLAHRGCSRLRRVNSCLAETDKNLSGDSEALRKFEKLLKDELPVTQANAWFRAQRLELKKLNMHRAKVRQISNSLSRVIGVERIAQ